MPRSRFPRFGFVALVAGLLAACGGDEAASCPPTDATCQPPASTPLVVSTVIPADGARHVDALAPVIVTFSRPVQPASVTSASVTVGSAVGTLSVNGATATFTPSAPMVAGADHAVRVNGVRDLDGTGMAMAFTSSFTTRSTPVCDDCPATAFTRADVEPQGKVVQTTAGFTVEGSLSLKTSDTERITFLGADLDVRFDESGRLQSLSGKVEIPSPHERIAFADPVRADVGVFSGRFLNDERDLGILLKDDTDYFVFDFEKQLSMSIATGETGGGATKPVVVRIPDGKRMLMVVDYRDPMYYVYGQHDLLGAAGMGWSLNGRIPFVPKMAVNGLGAFDGRTTRTGTFPVFKIMSVTGQMVDNNTTELHLSETDPFASTLRSDYQSGFNGDLSLDLFLKDMVGLEIKVASASGGVRREISTQTGFNGYAFARGSTSRDDSWWPAFIPARPVTELDVQARIESSGSFQAFLGGEFGWDLPAGRQSMSGRFDLTDQAMTLKGAIRDGTVDLNITGVVTTASTAVSIAPPPALLAALHGEVNDQVLTQIAAAQKAYDDLQKATADYKFEVSLRGIRDLIPGVMDVAKQGLTTGITNALQPYERTVFYGLLKGIVDSIALPYYQRLDGLKAAARSSQDNATTRAVLKAALTTLVANKTLKVDYTHYIGPDCCRIKVWGPVVFSRQILNDAWADSLTLAASYVDNIPAKSNIMISMQQVYDRIPDRLIFEQVRDDIQNGLLVMEDIGELGFVLPHAAGQRSFNVFAVIGGRRYEVGAIEALTVAALSAKLTDAMIAALRVN